jgi:hypothetical protein
MPSLKYPEGFYITVNRLCRCGPIRDVTELLRIEWPSVPAASIRNYIGRARHFGDCRKDWARGSGNGMQNITMTQEEIFKMLTPEQIDDSHWRMLTLGHEAILEVKRLKEECSKLTGERDRLAAEIKHLHENASRELATQLAVKEGLLKTYGEG